MARVLGIRANTVIAAAFALSGLLAGTAAILLTAQTGTASPTMGLNIVLVAFTATILGGMGSLRGAVLGGFSIGVLTVTLQASLPLDLRPYRDAFVFAAVLAVLRRAAAGPPPRPRDARPRGPAPASPAAAAPAGRARLGRSRRRIAAGAKRGPCSPRPSGRRSPSSPSPASWRCSSGRSGRTRSIASCSGWSST